MASKESLRSWVDIDLSAFRHNLLALMHQLPQGTRVMQIVKADAYGHGALEIARAALAAGVDSLGVANADEGAILRYHGFCCPILILSPALISEIPLIIENKLTPSVSDEHFAEQLSAQAMAAYPIHLNIDTGMGRSGVSLNRAEEFYEKCRKLPHIFIEGIYTHFSAAENDAGYTEEQISAFNSFLEKLPDQPQLIHSSNSSALLHRSFPPGNMVRIGALSYGFYTDSSQKVQLELKPVLTFRSRISCIKTAAKGDYIGYNRTFRCEKKTRYAIIPVGYADGYDYLLSNKGKIAIDGKLLPVIGKVSMDMTAVDITDNAEVEIGQEVILLGADPHLRVEDAAALYNGSAYELLCQTGRRARRFYYDKGELVSTAPLLRREFVSFDYNDENLNRIIESAVQQRTQSLDIASFVYHDILQNIFSEQDRNVFFRHSFRHEITFENASDIALKDYFICKTSLTFHKKLASASFRIACASNEENLQRYFLEPDVEYRWLLDESLPSSPEYFQLVSAYINDIPLYNSLRIINNCIEITCYNEKLHELVGKEVVFSINTSTYYPRSYHQLSVFITGITKGIELKFKYPEELIMENIIPIFSGKKKYPQIERSANSALLSSGDWLFPTSGVTFVYSTGESAREKEQ